MIKMSNQINMELLLNYLLLFDGLNEQQITLVKQKTKLIQLQPGDYLAEAGIIFGKLAFVGNGLLRYNYYNSKAENFTISLIADGNIIVGANHVIPNFPPSDYLQAITKCDLYVIDAEDMEIIAATILNWERLVKKISQKSVCDKKERVLPVINDNPVNKVAAAYLNKFDNVKKYLSTDQMTTYLQPATTELSSNQG
jgi:hypothetical protein